MRGGGLASTGISAFAEQMTESELTVPWDWVCDRSQDRLTSEDFSRLAAVKTPKFPLWRALWSSIHRHCPPPPYCLCSLWSDSKEDSVGTQSMKCDVQRAAERGLQHVYANCPLVEIPSQLPEVIGALA